MCTYTYVYVFIEKACGSPPGMSVEKDDRLQKLYDREGRNTSSTDPKMMNARVFIGNLAADKVNRQDVMRMFEPYGKVLGVSLHRSYGFVQFDKEESAEEAVKGTNGQIVQGLRVDVNIATERRKDAPPERRGGYGGRGSGRRPRSPSPPYRHRDRYEMDRPRWERMNWRGSPPPMGPPFRDRDRDRDRDPYYDRYLPPPGREPYSRPRDDPYERYNRDRERYPPPRDFLSYGGPPPRDHPSPRSRYPPDYPPRWGSPEYDRGPDRERHMERMERERERERERESYRERERRPVLPRQEGDEGSRPVDMEIIVINRQQREYAALVSSRVQSIGLVTQTQHLSPTVSLADALDDAAQQGLLYAVIITSQHELHRSVTLTILHGRNPQEHKNMPLDDALALIHKDFEHYSMTARASARKPQAFGDISQLLGKAASGAALSSDELSSVISALQKQKGRDESDSPHHDMHLSDKDSNTAEAIQRQQADLQAKILSLLGSNAVVPTPSIAKSPSSQPTRSSSYDSSHAVSYPPPGHGYGGYGSGGGGGTSGSGYSGYSYNY